MTLELEEGATLLGHIDKEYYPVLPGYTVTTDEKDEYYLGTWEGNPLNSHASLITGIHVENVSIIGKGIIDGNAAKSDWWINPKQKRDIWRPRTIFLNGCNNILLQGVTVRNSPSWTIHPYLSTHLNFIDLKIKNHKDSPNTDGLDPESCSDVNIIGVDFSVGDDCIAIKSGKLYMGKRLKRPSERMDIRNCRMRHGHGAVVIGSEMSGGARDIKVSRCVFEQTDRGLRIKTRRGRGADGVIDNIEFEHIKMSEVLTPFVINMFYFCDPDGKSEYVWSKESLPVDEYTPYLGRFKFNQIDCDGCEWAAAYFRGLPEQLIQEIEMKDIHIRFKQNVSIGHPAMMSFIEPVSKQGIVADYINKLCLENVVIEGYEGDKLIISNVNEISEK
jgi:polygalacturonase